LIITIISAAVIAAVTSVALYGGSNSSNNSAFSSSTNVTRLSRENSSPAEDKQAGSYSLQIAHADNKLDASAIPPPDASAIPPPELPDATINALKQIAFGLPEVKQWSADGWQFAKIAYIGVDSPSLKWNYAMIYLMLPPTVKAPAYCENGWEADVKIDLDTMKPVEFYAPSASDHVCAQDWFRPP